MTAPSTFSEHSSDSEPSDTPPAGADEVVADRANRGRWARRLAVAAVVAGAAAALIYGGPSDAADPVPQAAGPKVVVVAEAAPAEVSRSRVFSGVVEASEHASLSFTIPGRVVERPVDVGTHVEAGEVLARLDRTPFRNQLATVSAQRAELETRRDQAGRDARRLRDLADARTVPTVQAERSESSLEALEASDAAARAGVAEARRLLREAVLQAPFDGTITAVALEAGEYANPGVPVVELTGDGPLELEVEVPEAVVPSLAAGQPVEVVFPLLDGRTVAGTISALGGGTRGPARLFPVRVQIPRSEGLLAGMTAELHVDTPIRAALTVPIDAVINPGGERPSVFVVREGVVERTAVEVVDVLDGRAFVEAELGAGDQVVVGGHAGLASGVKVEVRS